MGICGLSCQLCPMYQTNADSRCEGCKSISRITLGCPFITCAVMKKEVEFCWECKESPHCEKWRKHREAGVEYDSFKCYQKLEDDIIFIQKNGFEEHKRLQNIREDMLKDMLDNFNEGRSKSYYCVAATVMHIEEIQEALIQAKEASKGFDMKSKSKVLHAILDEMAQKKGYHLKLRKKNG
ncbi:DUF3795 domain-containing protein [Dehalobacter sp. DCM]|uniref:DUF3795 domain-containing protein n=1 Tax=Dehalobacter sp. DCM TaxID=2907827 RepID=UPI003081C5A4